MKPGRRLAIFTDKFPLIGPLVWILAAQYFAAQLIVASAWPTGYNWAGNFISDLGNTACGQFASRYVCSPDHALMNASFILLGILMAAGSLFIYQEFRESRASLVGFSLMAAAGLGSLLVGAFPENTITGLHVLGAFLALGVGDVSIIVLARSLTGVRPSFRILTLWMGIISLAAFLLFASGAHLGVGRGTLERFASYPQTLWLILFGIYMTSSHFRGGNAKMKLAHEPIQKAKTQTKAKY